MSISNLHTDSFSFSSPHDPQSSDRIQEHSAKEREKTCAVDCESATMKFDTA